MTTWSTKQQREGTRHVGVQGFRGSGVQEFRGSGVQGSGAQGLRGSGAQGFRGSGVQGFKGSGIQGLLGSGGSGVVRGQGLHDFGKVGIAQYVSGWGGGISWVSIEARYSRATAMQSGYGPTVQVLGRECCVPVFEFWRMVGSMRVMPALMMMMMMMMMLCVHRCALCV